MIPRGCQSSERRPRRGVAVVCVAPAPTPTETKSPRDRGQMPPKLFCIALTPLGLPPFLQWGWLVPALFTGLAARPVDIPKRKKGVRCGASTPNAFAITTAPCGSGYGYAIVGTYSHYVHGQCSTRSAELSRGEYPFRITTAPPTLCLPLPSLDDCQSANSVWWGSRGRGAGRAHGGAIARSAAKPTRGAATRRATAPPPATTAAPKTHDDHRRGNHPCGLQITSLKTPPFAGFFNSNNRERRTTHQRKTSSAERTADIVGLSPVPASHHSPPPAAAHQRRPPRRRGGTREHHQTGDKPTTPPTSTAVTRRAL